MKVSHFGRGAAILSVASLALVACNGDDNGNGGGDADEAAEAAGVEFEDVSGTIYSGGASSHETAMDEWIAEFEHLTDNQAQVEYAGEGSGAGRASFLDGEFQFAGSDAVMSDEEYEESLQRCGDNGAFHLPTYIAPIGLAVNLEGVDSINLDSDTLGEIFAGEITSWDDPAIAEQNEDADLPSTPITVVHRADSSGTTENFLEYLEATASNWDWEPDGEWPTDISAESAGQTSGVLDLAGSTDGAITYADLGQIGDEFALVNVEVGGEYTEPTPEAAAEAVLASERVEGQSENNMAFEITRDTEEVGAYPIVQIAYTIWCNEYESEEEADLVAAFAAYIVSEDAQELAHDQAGSAPITDDLRDEALEAISEISGG